MSRRAGGLGWHFPSRRGRGDSVVKRTPSVTMGKQISGPVELIHASNPQSYKAPDISLVSGSGISAALPKTGESDSDSSADPTVRSAASSPPTSPDVSDARGQLSSGRRPQASAFLDPAPRPAKALPDAETTRAGAPVIPRRAPEHTKVPSLERLRGLSISRLSSSATRSKKSGSGPADVPAPQAGSSVGVKMVPEQLSSWRARTGGSAPDAPAGAASPGKVAAAAKPPAAAPSKAREPEPGVLLLGKDLSRVGKIAEELDNVPEKLHPVKPEDVHLGERGLCKLGAQDYIDEIAHLVAAMLSEVASPAGQPTNIWV